MSHGLNTDETQIKQGEYEYPQRLAGTLSKGAHSIILAWPPGFGFNLEHKNFPSNLI